jgi:hypothetical protein
MGLKGFKLYFATSQQTPRRGELKSSIQIFVETRPKLPSHIKLTTRVHTRYNDPT